MGFASLVIAQVISMTPPIHQGLSAYQIMSPNWTPQQCAAMIYVMKQHKMTEIGLLWRGFGEQRSCIKRIKRHVQPRWWVHISNEVRRNRGDPMAAGDLLPDLTTDEYNKRAAANNPGLRRRLRGRVDAIVSALGPNLGGISSGLEHSFSNKTNAHILRWIKRRLPHGVLVIDNPLLNSDFKRGPMCELHGYTEPTPADCRARCIRNPDGDGLDHPLGGPGGYYRATVQEGRSWFGRSVVDSCISLHWLPRWQARGADFRTKPWERGFDFNRGDTEVIDLITEGLFI